MTAEEIEAGRDGMREFLAAAHDADDCTELCELGAVVATTCPDRCTGCGTPVSDLVMKCSECVELPSWPAEQEIEGYEAEDCMLFSCWTPKINGSLYCAIHAAEFDRRAAAAIAHIDAIAEVGTPGTDYPEFVSITETSVYRIEREPGFPTQDEIACVKMMKLVGDGREFNAGDGIEAYSVVQNRDGTYCCDCADYVFRRSKVADQRTPEARCKHVRKLIEIGVFK